MGRKWAHKRPTPPLNTTRLNGVLLLRTGPQIAVSSLPPQGAILRRLISCQMHRFRERRAPYLEGQLAVPSPDSEPLGSLMCGDVPLDPWKGGTGGARPTHGLCPTQRDGWKATEFGPGVLTYHGIISCLIYLFCCGGSLSTIRVLGSQFFLRASSGMERRLKRMF